MSKQNVHILLRQDTYLQLKSRGVNISGIADQLLTQYAQLEADKTPEEEDIQKRIKDLEEEKKHLEEQLNTFYATLVSIHEKRENTLKEYLEEAKLTSKGYKESGLHRQATEEIDI